MLCTLPPDMRKADTGLGFRLSEFGQILSSPERMLASDFSSSSLILFPLFPCGFGSIGECARYSKLAGASHYGSIHFDGMALGRHGFGQLQLQYALGEVGLYVRRIDVGGKPDRTR